MSQEIVYGSLGYLAGQGKSIAETFATGVDAILMIDVSASMMMTDCRDGQSRYDAACAELKRLQRQLPGKLAIIEWSDGHAFCPGGMPSGIKGMTNMAGVLKFVQIADGAGIRFILISDGEPDSEDETLDVARKFSSHIDTIYIGPEGGAGADFLRRLSALTGGQSVSQSAREITQLAQTVTKLLTT
jgi:hypothetical protein